MTDLKNTGTTTPTQIKVVVKERGPYILYSAKEVGQQFILPDSVGESWYYRRGESFAMREDSPTPLCRCGKSRNQPLCDGSHEMVEWDSELTSPNDQIADDARIYESQEMILKDNEKYCCYARFCHPGGGVWHLTHISGEDSEARDLAIREATMCPSARLMAWRRGEENPYEFDFEPSVDLLEDPEAGCSAGLWLKGGITVERQDGEQYELRNRVVLCRCGHSSNKPYCDGAHAAHHWRSSTLSEIPTSGEEIPSDDSLFSDIS
ncbi:MAG: CDGSH iron-sulfur domain-containing protein [Rikenellaceae bacterium]